MNTRKYSLFGILGPLAAIFFIGLSITLSPWFSWHYNALSDLGHAVRSEVAQLFNFGLLMAGFFTTIYSITALKNHAKYTSFCLLTSALLLQLVATFDEVYGFLHFLASIFFFISLNFATLIYAVERKSKIATMAFMISFGSWVLYLAGIYQSGIAVPEIISSLATSSWIILSAMHTLDKS
ncbi:MAG: DUF998 domain-containing protein [Candidatus Bathyarchaeota archaeon]|nr:MAG: DUF998 domain-containing protein [Candidatus Bathyarchaeota archaeon]